MNSIKTAAAAYIALLVIASEAFAGTAATAIDYGYLANNAQIITGIDNREYYKLDDMLFPVPATAPEGVQSACTINNIHLFQDGIVYYRFTYGTVTTPITADKQEIFRAAINEWAKTPGFTFIEKADAENNFIVVTDDVWNFSTVGINDPSPCATIGINNWNIGTVAHEIGHALGLYHEHQRQDRDTYVTINTDNINPYDVGEFSIIMPVRQAPLLTDYDFLSIMHYNQYAGSTGGTTITCNAGYERYQNAIGDCCMVSALDRVGVARLYGKPEPGLCSISIEVEDSVIGSIVVGKPVGYGRIDPTLLTQANPGVPITLSLDSGATTFFGGWKADNALVDNASATSVEITPLGDCVVTATMKVFKTSFEGTTGSVITVEAPAAFKRKTSFGRNPKAKIGGKPAKMTGSLAAKAGIEITSSLTAGVYPVEIVDPSNGISKTCSITIVPPEIDEATYSNGTLTIDGTMFGKKPTVAVDGKKKTGKTVFNAQTGASTTTVLKLKAKPTTVTISNKAGTATYSL